jgi:hypothetical protein
MRTFLNFYKVGQNSNTLSNMSSEVTKEMHFNTVKLGLQLLDIVLLV